MIFIGPASRQDAGFEHSYDVLVDSYEADEDLKDPTFYKMAGRVCIYFLNLLLSVSAPTNDISLDGPSHALHRHASI